MARWEKTPGQGNARSLRPQTLGRAGVDPSVGVLGGLHDGAVPPPSGRRAGELCSHGDAAGMRPSACAHSSRLRLGTPRHA